MYRGFRDLIVWQKSMELVTHIYSLSESFPKSEMFELQSQLRRAAVSIPSNIAEGQGRESSKEFLHHLSIAYGSLMEVETQSEIAKNLGFITDPGLNAVNDKCGEVARLLNGLRRSLRVTKPTTDDRRPTTIQ